MEGQPAEFESIGNRLGLRIVDEQSGMLKLAWRGPRFPAFLCLGIALLLLFVSVPILEALRLRGFVGPAGSLWYFPLMNGVLFAISLYLISQRRTIIVDSAARKVTLNKRSLYQKRTLSLPYDEIDKLELALDKVYSGYAVAGSSAAESFPVPALRIVTTQGMTILLDRGNKRRLAEVGKKISERLAVPLTIHGSVAL